LYCADADGIGVKAGGGMDTGAAPGRREWWIFDWIGLYAARVVVLAATAAGLLLRAVAVVEEEEEGGGRLAPLPAKNDDASMIDEFVLWGLSEEREK